MTNEGPFIVHSVHAYNAMDQSNSLSLPSQSSLSSAGVDGSACSVGAVALVGTCVGPFVGVALGTVNFLRMGKVLLH